MKQQIAFEYEQTPYGGQHLIQRKTLVPPGQGNYYMKQPASQHRAGHSAGLHDESAPFITGFDSDEDDTRYSHVPARTMPRSAIRYRPTQQQTAPRKRMHWLVFVGLAMFIMILGWIAFNAIGEWWQTKIDDLKYGYPRTFQTDANVGHFGFVSHFVALNLKGKIEIIETEPQNPNQQQSTRMYIAATLATDQDLQPVTLHFEDLTGSGKLDMLVFVGNSLQIPFYNTGTGFQPQPPGNH